MRKWISIAWWLIKPAPVAAREATYGMRFTNYTVTGPEPTE